MGCGPVLGPSRGAEQKHQSDREVRHLPLMPALSHQRQGARGSWREKELIPQPKGELLDHRGAVPTISYIVAGPHLVHEGDFGMKPDLAWCSSIRVRLAYILFDYA